MLAKARCPNCRMKFIRNLTGKSKHFIRHMKKVIKIETYIPSFCDACIHTIELSTTETFKMDGMDIRNSLYQLFD